MSKTILTAIIGLITLNSCNPQEDRIWMKIKDVYCEQLACGSIGEGVFEAISFLFLIFSYYLFFSHRVSEKDSYKYRNYLPFRWLGIFAIASTLYIWSKGIHNVEWTDLYWAATLGFICGTILYFFAFVTYLYIKEGPFTKYEHSIEVVKAALALLKQGKLAENLQEDIDEVDPISIQVKLMFKNNPKMSIEDLELVLAFLLMFKKNPKISTYDLEEALMFLKQIKIKNQKVHKSKKK